MSDIYAPCLCGSGKKFKFCCYGIQKKGGVIPTKFSFGQDGRPHYVSGPNDYELYNVKEVVEKVSKAQGHYVVHVSA